MIFRDLFSRSLLGARISHRDDDNSEGCSGGLVDVDKERKRDGKKEDSSSGLAAGFQ